MIIYNLFHKTVEYEDNYETGTDELYRREIFEQVVHHVDSFASAQAAMSHANSEIMTRGHDLRNWKDFILMRTNTRVWLNEYVTEQLFEQSYYVIETELKE